MQASLESESSRQKRQQEYGYRPRGGARAVSRAVDMNGLAAGEQDGRKGRVSRATSRAAVEGEHEQEPTSIVELASRKCHRSVRQRKALPVRDDSKDVSTNHLNHQPMPTRRYNLRKRRPARGHPSSCTDSDQALQPLPLAAGKPVGTSRRQRGKANGWWKTANAVRILFLLPSSPSLLTACPAATLPRGDGTRGEVLQYLLLLCGHRSA